MKNLFDRAFYEGMVWFDAIASIAVVGAMVGVLWKSDQWESFSCFLEHDGTSVYGAVLSAFAAILGFSITAMALVATILSTKKFRSFYDSPHYTKFWGAFTLTIRVLGVATTFTIAAIFLNRITILRLPTIYGFVFLSTFAVVSLARATLTLEYLVTHIRPSESTVSIRENPHVEP